MSPTAEKKPMGVTRVGDATVFTVDADVEWKTQRKLKHQRNMQKRANANNANANNANNANGRRSGPTPMHHHAHGARSIPGRRKEKPASVLSPIQLSRSVPMTARSWPPEKDNLVVDPSDESLDADHWTLDGAAVEVRTLGANARVSLLSSSAPERSNLSRSAGAKREARTMTLFESAMIFNEAGNLLSHDNFDAMASSPEVGPHSAGVNRRKTTKRRVGRHRPEKKKGQESAGDRLSQDDIVLELMQVLLPDMDVTKELNLLFLGGARHQGDVFHFEDDDASRHQHSHIAAKAAPGGKLLTIDVRQFEASLSKLLFETNEIEYAMPTAGSTANELVDMFLTEPWLAMTMLRIVKLDVLAQYDAFAVLLAVYRALPSHREIVLKSLEGVCLAIYDHQAMAHLTLASEARKRVSMKGVIAMLHAILSVTECEIAETPDVFGDSPQAIEETLDTVCDRMVACVQLLMRSSPGSTKYQSDNNHVEKFQEGSESVEATTYSALGDVINRLAAFSPLHGQRLLAWMVHKWPQRTVQLELFYVRFLTGMLMHFLIRGVCLPEALTAKAFARVRACIASPHFLIAQEATTMCGNLPLMDLYLSRDQELREQIAATLHANATGHWNDRIRQLSDEYFDALLDFA